MHPPIPSIGLGAVRQSCLLAVSGFVFMSFLAAIGWACGEHGPNRGALDEARWREQESWLAAADYATAPRSREVTDCNPELPDLQPVSAALLSARARSTKGCGSPTRSMSRGSVSSRSATASSRRPAAMSMVAYSTFAPVANR